jgi:hypothetical protein
MANQQSLKIKVLRIDDRSADDHWRALLAGESTNLLGKAFIDQLD